MRKSCFLISFYGLLTFASLLNPPLLSASADVGITFEVFIARYLEQAPRARLARLGVAQAEARVLEAGILANPTLEVQHSQLTGSSEQTATLGMTLPLSGRRGARVDAARAGIQSAEGDAHQALVLSVASLLRTTYESFHLRQIHFVMSILLEKATDLETIARRRADSGQISGFDGLRLHGEVDLLRSQVLAIEVAETRNKAALHALFGNSSFTMFGGSVQYPLSLPDASTLIEQASQQGALASVRARIVQSQHLLKAAQHQALPEPTLLGGVWRVEEGAAAEVGFTAGLSIPLPFTDRGRAEAAVARADLQALETEAQALEAELSAYITGGLETARLAQARALAFENGGLKIAEMAQGEAERAYEAGELDLATLMETLRAGQTAQIHALDAHLEARLAEIAVQTYAGWIPGEKRISGENTRSGGAP